MSDRPKIPIYLDNNSTTRLDPRVLECMLPWLGEDYGNPASRHHAFGWRAKAAVSESRDRIAAALGAPSSGIVFTSGATEANNLALKGVAAANVDRGRHIIATEVEHKAVLDPLAGLERRGWSVTLLKTDCFGLVSPETLAAAIRPDTVLVSIIWANNEVGSINDMAAISALCRERGILIHSDATQAVGKIPVNIEETGLDLISFSAHKFNGPKGIGALAARGLGDHIRMEPQMEGGGHESGYRSGTLNPAAIVGMGRALILALEEMTDEAQRLVRLRERLREGIMGGTPEVTLNGHPTRRLPGNLSLSFRHAEGEGLLMSLHDVALSTGSACTSASLKPSHVLKAIGLEDDMVHSSVRFGLGRWTTEEEIDYVIRRVSEEVARLRAISPAWERFRRADR